MLFSFFRKVLDIDGGPKKEAGIVTKKRNPENVNQEWFINEDKSISTGADNNLVLDFCGGKFVAGVHVIAYPHHGGTNQHFIIQSAGRSSCDDNDVY